MGMLLEVRLRTSPHTLNFFVEIFVTPEVWHREVLEQLRPFSVPLTPAKGGGPAGLVCSAVSTTSFQCPEHWEDR